MARWNAECNVGNDRIKTGIAPEETDWRLLGGDGDVAH